MNEQTPIQPVAQPILNSPYAKPEKFWQYPREGGAPYIESGRRPAQYWYKIPEQARGQMRLNLDEGREDLPIVNALREDVRRWRGSGWEMATPVTKELLRYWWDEKRGPESGTRRLFFCQLEAVETIIYLREILQSGRAPRWKPEFDLVDRKAFFDQPAEQAMLSLERYCCKMATGSGKTVVMAMLIAWAFCNRGRNPADERFPAGVLVCCPNLTVKERLQVLRPEVEGNYYEEFDMAPPTLRSAMRWGKVLVTNWHAFALKNEHSDGGQNSRVINKGPEDAPAFARDRLRELFGRMPIMVLNDEAHHCYRPKIDPEQLSRQEKEEYEEATVWIEGLDRINNARHDGTRGIAFCVDLSATPFYIAGSGYTEGSPLPWIVSDFGLVDAIESGIVKIPRLPVADTTGRPDPKYFRLWKNITGDLAGAQKLPGGRPKPDVVYAKAEPALIQLAGQWKERFDYHANKRQGEEFTPPVMIVVCDNTEIAEVFFREISGQSEGEEGTIHGTSRVLEEFSNTGEYPKRTIRIDSELLSQAENADEGQSRQAAAEELRRIVATVGKEGQPGEQVRCVVSVAMLTEGWDANNVTHILGVRAFGSQLLCEQVVGRGLRRIDYVPDPQTGLLTPEYVDVYGIPFSVVPFKGRASDGSAPEDRPKFHVHAVAERAGFEIRFPVVEGYAFDLEKNLITCDVEAIPKVVLEPNDEPTATFISPAAGYEQGRPGRQSAFGFDEHNRQAFYAANHPQTIAFNIAHRVVERLMPDKTGPRRFARHQLFPQVFAFVNQFIQSRVDFRGCNRSEIGMRDYVDQIVERFTGANGAIRPNQAEGEPPLLPILNPHQKSGSTASVNFKTVKSCRSTRYSHVNLVALDTETWEASTAFYLERAADAGRVRCYARNDHLGFVIPYEFEGVAHDYVPDWLVRLADGSTLILETKGYESAEDRAKPAAAKKWVDAVNNWGGMGRWRYHVNYDPHRLGEELERLNPALVSAG